MSMPTKAPDDIWENGPDKALLFMGSAILNSTPADHMFVYHYAHEEEVLVFKVGTERKVVMVSPYMKITSSTPAVPASAEIKDDRVEDVSAEDQQRLLAIYDRLPRRCFR